MGILDNKIALVTGASKNIGSEIALALAKEGATVFINYNKNEEAAKKVLEESLKYNPNCEIVKADVSNKDQVSQMIKTIVDNHGKIDILINNAGIAMDKTLKNMDIDTWSRVIDTNLNGTFFVTKESLPFMPEGSNIINISSISADHCPFGQANYASSKAAVNALTKTLSKEVAKKNIRVNAISPGFIQTDMTERMPGEIKQKYLSMIPLRRFGKAEDIVKGIFFILDTDYLTGSNIKISGGL